MERPILFSTAMVQAILEGRKTQTRRIVKPQTKSIFPDKKDRMPKAFWTGMEWVKPPYQPGDILWVRETWCNYNNKFYYKADKKCYGCTEDGICMPRGIESHTTCELCESVGVDGYIRWRPSIHMPREAARIFLKVKDVRVERLQEISFDDAIAEGMGREGRIAMGISIPESEEEFNFKQYPERLFKRIWNGTIKQQDIDKYGWDANPWVWVIEFENTVFID